MRAREAKGEIESSAAVGGLNFWWKEGESGSYVVGRWVGRLSEVAMEKRLKGDISLPSPLPLAGT